jgi:hypothetical protein
MSWIPSVLGVFLNIMIIFSLTKASNKRDEISNSNIRKQDSGKSREFDSSQLKPILRKKIIFDSRTTFQTEKTVSNLISCSDVMVSSNQDLQAIQKPTQLKKTTRIIIPQFSQERQITVVLISISLTFLIFTLPFSIHELLRKLYPKEEKFQNITIQRIVLFLLDCLHATNFILYCLIGKKFRNQLINILKCKEEL